MYFKSSFIHHKNIVFPPPRLCVCVTPEDDMIAAPLLSLLCGLAGAAADYDQHHYGRHNLTAVPQKRLFNEDIAYSELVI